MPAQTPKVPGNRRLWTVVVAAVIVLVVICCCCCCGGGPAVLNENKFALTVCSLNDQATSSGSGRNARTGHQYMVFGIPESSDTVQTYIMEDGLLLSPPKLRTTTSDAWGSLSVGAVYDVATTGWRNGYGSTYPNLFVLGKASGKTPANCPKR